MELNTNTELTDGCKYVYKERTTEQKKKLLDENDKTNTQRATTQAVNNFCFFLRKNRLPNIEDITPPQLNDDCMSTILQFDPRNRNNIQHRV